MRSRIHEQDDLDSPVEGMMQEVDPAPDSVDDQIDALIIRYEKESIDAGEEKEEMFESLNNLSLRFLLEQDEEGAGEESAPPATGSETPKEAPKEPVVEKPPLDIDMFTKKIARLVMNSRTLLQVEEVVVSRASEFLKKNYGQSYVEQMVDILDQQYDFGLEGEDRMVDVPISVGAGVKTAGG
jgi:hypothetical protein